MTKISNQTIYVPDTEISSEDYFIGTDADKSLLTASFKVGDIGSHYNMTNGVRNFDYVFYQHQGVSPTPTDGYFYSNGNTQVLEDITYLIFPKKTSRGKDSSQFFDSMAIGNPFDLTIAQKIDNNTVFFFTINSIETFANYYKLNVAKVFFPIGKALEYVLSYAVFSLKTEGVSVHNNLSGLNDGDYIHLTAAEKVIFDNQSGVNTGDQDLSGLEPAFSKNTAFNKNFGTVADTVTEGNDSRLSDARTPLAHTHAQSDVVGLVAALNNKLDKNISTLPAVSLPLVGTDKLTVNRAGVDYSVDKSELGGGTSLRTESYEFVTGNQSLAASTSAYTPRYDVANSINNCLFETIRYNWVTEAVTDSRMLGRNITFNQKAIRATINYALLSTNTTFRVFYFKPNPSGSTNIAVDNLTIWEKTIVNAGGFRQSLVIEIPSDVTMEAGGIISYAIFNNNVVVVPKGVTITIDTEATI